jgi:competence protein ComEA
MHVVNMDDMDVRIPALSRRQLFGVAAAAAVLVLLLVRHLGGGSAAPAVTPVQPVVKPKAATPKLVVVDVAGAVRRPGLYRLREGSRIDDAIATAGGATSKAQLDSVNLAAPVADGEQVVVPGRGAAAAGVAAASPAAAGSAPSAPLDLNSATLEQLENLPGIGPVTAQKILDYRQQHGAFHSIVELQGVPGIGPAHMAQLKGLVIP